VINWLELNLVAVLPLSREPNTACGYQFLQVLYLLLAGLVPPLIIDVSALNLYLVVVDCF
jgi:hypothetical protein